MCLPFSIHSGLHPSQSQHVARRTTTSQADYLQSQRHPISFINQSLPRTLSGRRDAHIRRIRKALLAKPIFLDQRVGVEVADVNEFLFLFAGPVHGDASGIAFVADVVYTRSV